MQNQSNRKTTFDTQMKAAVLERFSVKYSKTKTKVITLTNHNRHRQSDEPIRTRSKYM